MNKLTNRIEVNFSFPSTEKRLFIYDEDNNLLLATYVAHGSGSGEGAMATVFSNDDGSHCSCLGRFRIGEIYIGKHGKSRRLDGLDSTNSNCRERDIVIHSAYYIGNGQEGHSFGCFAVPLDDIDQVLTLVEDGSILTAHD